MKVTAKESFGKFLTKGKDYEVVQDVDTNYLILDDTGNYSGWKKDRFETSHLDQFGWELNVKEL